VPYYSSGSVVSVGIYPLIFGHWNQLSFTTVNTANTSVKIQVYRADDSTLISDTDLPGNSAGFSSSPVDLSGVPYSATIGGIFLKATLLTTNTNETPRLNDWTVTWTVRNGVASDPRPATGPWPMWGRDNRHSGQMDGTLSSAYTPAWANTQASTAAADYFGSGILTGSGDVVVNKHVTSGSDPYTILVLDKNTGAVKWSFVVDKNQAIESPSIEGVTRDGTIYARSNVLGDTYPYTLIAVRNGQLLWSRAIHDQSGYGWDGQFTLDDSGAILMRQPHQNITKYSYTGATLWSTFVRWWDNIDSPSIGPGNTVYSTTTRNDFNFVILSATGGTLLTQLDSTISSFNFSVVDGSTAYIPTRFGQGTDFPCNTSGSVIRLAANGTRVWQKYTPTPPAQIAMDTNNLYVRAGCKNGEVLVLRKSDGTILKTLGDTTTTAGQYLDARIIVDHGQNSLLNTRTNRVAIYPLNATSPWQYAIPARSNSPYGSASQFYVSWGTGVLAFKPWTLATTASGTSTIAGSPVTVTAASSMLPADPVTAETNKVQAVMQDGQKIALSYVSTDSGGTTHWSGQYTPSASDPGGFYTGTIEASNARVQTGTGTSFAAPAPGTSNTGLKLTFGYTVQALTSTAITSSESTDGQTLILTATVSPSTAGGSVSFYDGSLNLGSATITNGTASFDLPAFPLSVGTHSFTAAYGGATTYAPSTSNAISPTIRLTGTATTTGGGGGGGGGRRTSTAALPITSVQTTTAPSSSASPALTSVAAKRAARQARVAQAASSSAPFQPHAGVSPSSSSTDALNTRFTTVSVNLRSSTSKQSKSKAQISTGTAVTLVQVLKDWAKVQTKEGKTGYVLRRYLRK
jgi:hypothetical protein